MRTGRLLTIAYPLLIAAGLTLVGCTKGGGSGDVPAPQKLESERVLGYVALPGLEQVIQDVVAVMGQFVPEQANPDMLKMQIGAMLGDPQLQNLDLGKPIVAVAFRPEQPGPMPTPPMAFYIPAKAASPYAETLAQQGVQTKFTGGVLLAAQTPQDLELAEKNLGFYNGLAGEIEGTARLYLHIGRLLETFGPMIDQGVRAMEEQMKGALGEGSPLGQPEQMMGILAAEIQGFLALARECEDVQADIDLGKEIVKFDKVVTGKPGSELAAFFTASAAKPAVSTSLVGDEAILAGAFHCDPATLGGLFEKLLEEMRKTPEVAKLLPPGVTDLWTDLSWWAGDASMRMAAVDEGMFTMDYAMGVQDADKYLSVMESASKLFEPGSALAELYKGMGMPLEVGLEKDVRKNGDVSVHRFKMAVAENETEGSPPMPGMEMIQGMLRDYEMALVNGQAVVSQDPAGLDALIDAARSGAAKPLDLAAVKAFGEGRHGYMDYDILRLLKSLFQAMPFFGEFGQVFDKVTAKGALVFATTFADGRMLVQGGIPLQPFVQLFNELKGQ
jgi:hypothetical protein